MVRELLYARGMHMHMHMPPRWTLTGTLLAGLLACGGGGGDTTSAGATDGSTGGTGGSEGGTTASPTNDPTNEPTTGGMSNSGTDTTAESSTGPGPMTTIPDPTTGVGETGPMTTIPDTDPDTGSTETTIEPETTGTTGEPGLCPPDPNDSECATCTKARCCDELLACLADEDCGCFSGCLAMGGDPMTCGMECMANPMMNEFLMALRQCNNMKCSDACMMP